MLAVLNVKLSIKVAMTPIAPPEFCTCQINAKWRNTTLAFTPRIQNHWRLHAPWASSMPCL